MNANGTEIFDWAVRIGDHIQKQARLNELRGALAKVGTVCGDCNLWMKSSQCPREKNVRGQNHGPSMNAPICETFVEDGWATERREKLKAELAEESK